MRQPDTSIISPYIKDDISATRELAAAFSKLSEMMRDIYDNLRIVKVVTTAPSATELLELFNTTDVVILHSATQNLRCVYYKYQGTVYKIQSA